MTHGNDNTMTPADFERLLDVYGSDRTRWPVEARASAGQLVARDRAARRLLAQAEALDRVLERAPLPTLASEAALAERIVVSARRSPRMVRLGDGRVAAPAPSGQGSVIPWPVSNARWRRLAGSELPRAAGLLAASLLFGLFIGVSNLSQSVVPVVAEMTGLTTAAPNAYSMAQIDPLEEDLL